MTPEKLSVPTTVTALTGNELVPFTLGGANGNATAALFKKGKSSITVGKTGSGADFECSGTNDQIQINAALTLAATTGGIDSIEILGYGYDFCYTISGVITILSGTTSGKMINILGKNTVIRCANGYSGDMLITKNFYTEINSNFNSFSTIENGVIAGLTLEGPPSGGVIHTLTYVNAAAFPGTGDTTKMYIDRSTNNGEGTGYLWNGSAYVTTGIADTGKHWRAYAYHHLKLYGQDIMLRDLQINTALEFGLYSEQTNTDTTVFNDYGVMAATLYHIDVRGYNLGGINWLGPHDSHWDNVSTHTDEFSAPTVLHNIYVSSGTNYNGGGLVWRDVHPWNGTATYGTNVLCVNSSIRGDAYIEGSSNVGLTAVGSSLWLDLIVTNSGIAVQLTNCFNTNLQIFNYYQFVSLVTMVELVGTFADSQIEVLSVDTNNLSGSPKIYDVTGLTGVSNVLLAARIPYTTTSIDPGVTLAQMDALGNSYELDIVKMGSTSTATTSIKRLRKPSASSVLKTANYTLLAQDQNVVFDATSASLVPTLPSLTNYTGGEFFIKRLDATFTVGNSVTVTAAGGNTIDNASTYVLSTQGSAVRLAPGPGATPTNWIITGKV